MKVQNPLIGRSKGQAGGMVFTTLYGQNVAKAKPYSYRDAKTPVQIANRGLHLILVLLAASLKLFARSLWETQPTGSSAYSALIKQFQGHTTGTGADRTISLAGKEIGSGSFESPEISATYNVTTGVITAHWALPESATIADESEPVDILVFSKSGNILTKGVKASVILGDLIQTVELTAGLTAADLLIVVSQQAKLGGAYMQKNVKRFVQVTAA